MRLLVATPIAAIATEHLSQAHDVVLGYEQDSDVATLITDREALVLRSGVTISAEVIDAAAYLRLIIRAGSGIDNIDLDAAGRQGIRVARVPAASPQAVAELTLGLMFAAARNIGMADSLIRKGRWPKYELGGPLLTGKTMGIVGAGRIGAETGRLCAALGMRVLGCVESPDAAEKARLDDHQVDLVDFDTVIAASDYLSIHTPLLETTRGLINESVLARMKPGAILVNMSRGGVVDEAAVGAALRSGQLSAAAFDVHEVEGEGVVPQLAEFPNVVLTPHIGGMARETQDTIGLRVVEIVEAFLDGRLDETLTPDELVL